MRKKYTDSNGRCIVSGKIGVTLHHVHARGMGGKHDPILDEDWNLMPIQELPYHKEVHLWGLKTFTEEYPSVRQWLIAKGWMMDLIMIRWTHPRERDLYGRQDRQSRPL